MSYQVLARKWRPKRFPELVGQEHVVRALTHALDSNRVHHAFLFTGTRGVGKTTIARIFAKSLNCERGVGANPCGECSACRDIDAGRFMDLIEIDAASNTGVDDVRDVIENAQYTPARGKYKVYLIDEVHMLSKNAFNALLKTLEEPPAHVKFLLATTDPQKLPVTVLSRCLQFNLKRLEEKQIADQLAKILAAEQVDHDAEAIVEIARAGNGSLRDALSLLDQAIAYGGGALRGSDVRAMLGTIGRADVAGLIEAVLAEDAGELNRRIDAAAEFAPDFGMVLDEVAALLHRVALRQAIRDAAFDAGDQALIDALAQRMSAEEVHLMYQLAITGRRDLALAPSPRAGFEMALLRMLAFRPAAAATPAPATGGSIAPPAKPAPSAPPTPRAAPVAAPIVEPAAPASTVALDDASWHALVERLPLRGPARELALNLGFIEHRGGTLRLGLKPALEHLRSDAMLRQLSAALAPEIGAPKLQVDLVDAAVDTAAQRQQRARVERQSEAEAAVARDPFVQDLIRDFDARVVPGSIRSN